jgi:nucleoid DNA-binding protein
MCCNRDICEHTVACVDDLAIAAKALKGITDTLASEHNFKLKVNFGMLPTKNRAGRKG